MLHTLGRISTKTLTGSRSGIARAEGHLLISGLPSCLWSLAPLRVGRMPYPTIPFAFSQAPHLSNGSEIPDSIRFGALGRSYYTSLQYDV